MCVIAICRDTRIDDDQIEKMFSSNRHGAGVAWRETDRAGETWVRWVKGINDVKDVQELCRDLPLPYIAHFRITSIGPNCPELCHPFPIDVNTTVAVEGRTQGAVLFHNGTLNRWREYMFDVALKGGFKAPGGPWSDSRAMAWIGGCLGIGILEVFDEKVVAFGPHTIDAFTSRWDPVGPGLWTSNLSWKSGTSSTSYGAGFRDSRGWQDREPVRNIHVETKQLGPAPKEGDSGVSPDEDPFHSGTAPVRGQGAREETPQAGALQLRPTPDDVKVVEIIDVDDAAVLAQIEAEQLELGNDAVRFARSLNPNPYKRPLIDPRVECATQM